MSVRCIKGHTVVVSPELVLSPGFVVIGDDGLIEDVVNDLSERNICLEDILEAHIVLPGFVDIHNHGMGGAEDVLGFWSNPEHTLRLLAEQGTTSVLASLVYPEDAKEIHGRIFEATKEFLNGTRPGCAALEGFHAEGPIIASRGGLPQSAAPPDPADFREYLSSVPKLKVMTISPSVDAGSGYAYMKAIIEAGVTPSLGHDKDATEEEVLGALRLAGSYGARVHTTHLYNVMSFHHRLPSLANIALLSDFPRTPRYEGAAEPTVEIIGDSFHVSQPAVQLAISAKGKRKVCFITDAIAQSTPGFCASYCGNPIEVADDGMRVFKANTDTLVGSCAFVAEAFRRAVRNHGVALPDAVAMCSTTPARIAGVRHAGTLERGTRADIVLLDPLLNLECTVVAGRVAARRVPEVFACGAGGEAQLGNGSDEDAHSPMCWPEQSAPKTPVAAFSPSGLHGALVTRVGEVRVWGTNNFGQVGTGNVSSDLCVTPIPVAIPSGRRVVCVSAGWWHTCAVDEGGALFAWGRNTNGQCGQPDVTNHPSPVQVPISSKLISVSCGMKHTLALGHDGRAYGFGLGKDGQLGPMPDRKQAIVVSSPLQVGGLASLEIEEVVAGGYHSAFRSSCGRLYLCGRGKNGQLGNGFTDTLETPQRVGGIPFVSKVVLGWSHTAVLTDHGSVYCWGRNDFGQCGVGTKEKAVLLPARVTVGEESEAVWDIACGAEHTMALLSTGKSFSWGWNDHGQLGHGDKEDRKAPELVRGAPKSQRVYAGGAVSMFVASTLSKE